MSTVDENLPLIEKAQNSLQAEEDSERDQTKILGLPAWLVCVLWISLGVLAACYIEGWGVDTAFYVIVQIVTTIGYGDVTVQTERMKIWSSLYVMGTLMLIATYVGELLDTVLSAQTDFLKRRVAVSKKQAELKTLEDELSEFTREAEGTIASIMPAFVLFMLFVLSGTVFFGYYESCSCSYGVTAIEGCVEDTLEQCYVTGGATKSWAEAFYMSVITLTTVGFGDHSPKTRNGRIFGCFWMLCGVAATANLMGYVGKALVEHKRHKKHLSAMSYPLFAQIDASHDGKLSRNEFRHFALLRFGMVSVEDIREIDALFESIDTDKTGSLTFAEICKACDTPDTAEDAFRVTGNRIARSQSSV